MKIAVCSMFRDSQYWNGQYINQVDLFFRNMYEQAKANNVEFEFFLLEGDSKDDTFQKIEQYTKYYDIHLIKHDLGGRPPSSDGGDDRRKILSEVGNICLDMALKSDNNYILWSESDLIPVNNMLGTLLSTIKNDINWDETVALAPIAIIRFRGMDSFYDGWAYEGIDGEKWSLHDLQKFLDYPSNNRPMKSIGCTALLNAKILRKNNINFADGCFPKLCTTSIEKGYKVFCNLNSAIRHPSSACIQNRWI